MPGANVIPLSIINEAKADAAGPAAAGAAPGAAAPAGAAVVINWSAEGRELVDFAVLLLVPLSPTLATVYPETVRAQLAEHIGRVLQKYGLDAAALFGKWAPEMGLLIVAAPLIAPTVAAVRTDRAARASSAAGTSAPAADALPVPSDLTRFPGAASASETISTNPLAHGAGKT